MLHLPLIAAVLTVAPPQGTEITTSQIETCEKWGSFAELAMSAHQGGKSLSEQMKLSPDPRAYELTLEAYQAPRFIAGDQKGRAITSYRDAVFSECLTALSDPQAENGRPADFWTIKKPDD